MTISGSNLHRSCMSFGYFMIWGPWGAQLQRHGTRTLHWDCQLLATSAKAFLFLAENFGIRAIYNLSTIASIRSLPALSRPVARRKPQSNCFARWNRYQKSKVPERLAAQIHFIRAALQCSLPKDCSKIRSPSWFKPKSSQIVSTCGFRRAKMAFHKGFFWPRRHFRCSNPSPAWGFRSFPVAFTVATGSFTSCFLSFLASASRVPSGQASASNSQAMCWFSTFIWGFRKRKACANRRTSLLISCVLGL